MVNACGFVASSESRDTFAGGMPYFEFGDQWPVNDDNVPLAFLFQFSVNELPEEARSLYPELRDDSFVQFFIHPDYLFGMDLDNTTNGKVLVRTISNPVEIDRNFPSEFDGGSLADVTPLVKPLERVYYIPEMFESIPSYGSLDWDASSNDEGTVSPEYEFRLGGYPVFTQDDFRTRKTHHLYTLLLGSESGDNVMWGDMGVAGIWNSPEGYFIYWDCY